MVISQNEMEARPFGLARRNITAWALFGGLVRVAVEHTAHVPETLTFYMGKNTPERRTYIMENLV